MIKEFIEAWDAKKHLVEEDFRKEHPSYSSIVKSVVKIMTDIPNHGTLDPERIHVIDDGSWQGTILYIIATDTYQPSEGDYYFVSNYYGSCSGCDTLEGIRDNYTDFRDSDKPPTDEQVDQYMMLALHIVQGLKPLVRFENDN